MNRTKLLALAVTIVAVLFCFAAVSAAAPNSADDYLIVIEIDASRLTLYKGGEKIGAWPVAVGKPQTPSPVGVFRITAKERGWGTGFGTRWLGINCPWGKFGIHGTNKPASIGSAASHGCFRMHNRDVEKLYSLVPAGTKVIIESGPYGPFGYALRTLSPGDRGGDVKQVQIRLKNLGFYNGSLDGIYGEGMKQAVLQFKKSQKLQFTHDVDSATYRALGITLFE